MRKRARAEGVQPVAADGFQGDLALELLVEAHEHRAHAAFGDLAGDADGADAVAGTDHGWSLPATLLQASSSSGNHALQPSRSPRRASVASWEALTDRWRAPMMPALPAKAWAAAAKASRSP